MKKIQYPAHVNTLLNTLTAYKVHVVGGFVRDYLLKRPTKDLDLVTPVPLDDFLPAVQKISSKHYVIERYQAVMFGYEGYKITLTRLRKDIICDGRQAEVEFVDDLGVDVYRRDFTLNAIYADPDGSILDFVGGVDDIANQTVRFIGDPLKRIEEDVLRILRYVRFCSLFPTPMDEEVVALFCQFSERLKQLPQDKVNYEIKRIKAMPYGGENLRMCHLQKM